MVLDKHAANCVQRMQDMAIPDLIGEVPSGHYYRMYVRSTVQWSRSGRGVAVVPPLHRDG